MTQDRFPIFRFIFVTVAIGLLIACIYFAVTWHRFSSRLKAEEDAILSPLDADLSRPGQYRLEATQQYNKSAHGMKLVLHIPSAGENPLELTDLRGEVTLLDADGPSHSTTQPAADAAPLKSVRFLPGSDDAELYRGFVPTHFAFILDVKQGDPKLAGRPQQLYIRYALCGLEALGVFVAGALSLGSGLASAIILISVTHYTRKRRRLTTR